MIDNQKIPNEETDLLTKESCLKMMKDYQEELTKENLDLLKKIWELQEKHNG